jgi:short-subunit dehydrogenase
MKTIDDAADMTDRLFDNFERAETTDEDRFVTVLISKPGVGKSSVVARKARERGYDLIDLNLACIEPTDIIGLGARERRDDGTWMTVPALPSWANLALRGHTIILRG